MEYATYVPLVRPLAAGRVRESPNHIQLLAPDAMSRNANQAKLRPTPFWGVRTPGGTRQRITDHEAGLWTRSQLYLAEIGPLHPGATDACHDIRFLLLPASGLRSS